MNLKFVKILLGISALLFLIIGCSQMNRDEALEVRIKTDPHSPAKYRVICPLSNIPEFYEAFAVKDSDGMSRKPKEKVKIW